MKDKWSEGWGVVTDTRTHVCWDTSVLGRASLNEDRPPLRPLPCSRQQSLTIRFTHTPSRSLKVHLPNKRLLFYLTVPLMLTSSTTLQFVQHPYKKISITFFSSQLGKLRHREAGCFSKVMEAQEHGGLSFMESCQLASPSWQHDAFQRSIMKLQPWSLSENRRTVDLNKAKLIYIKHGSCRNHQNPRLY